MFILLLNRGLLSPDSCYYQAERGLSTTKINKNKVLKTFTGHQYNFTIYVIIYNIALQCNRQPQWTDR